MRIMNGDKRMVVASFKPALPSSSSFKSALPSGYTELESIETTGTQYIDTGIVSSQLEGRGYYIIGLTYTAFKTGYNANGCSKKPQVCVNSTSNNCWHNGRPASAYYPNLNQRYLVKASYENKGLYVDDKLIITNNDIQQNEHSITLAGLRLQNGTVSYLASEKIDSFKAFDDAGALIGNLIPCINPQNEVGMFDTVRQTFRGNAGTGSFIPHYKEKPTHIPQYYKVMLGKVQDTLYINGTDTLTSQIVQDRINKFEGNLSDVKKVVVGEGFTNLGVASLDIIDDYTELQNLILITYGFCKKNIYTNMTIEDNKFVKWVYAYEGFQYQANIFDNIVIDTIDLYNFNTDRSIFYSKQITVDTLIVRNESFDYGNLLTYDGRNKNIEKCFFPNVISFNKSLFGSAAYMRVPNRIFVGNKNASLIGNYFTSGNIVSFIYLCADNLNFYKTTANWTTYSEKLVGVIDGNNVYTDKGFNYPKLSATLTLNTSNGHLIENGTDLFEGYTSVWYSDEDCTQIISPANITADMTVYCKLTQ